jgi:uncharacterized phage protein (TIGR02218 family)
MTKSLPGGFSAHLAGLTQSVVELYKISASGMSVFTWTDGNRCVSYSGLTYDPWPIKRGKISFSSDFKVDQTEISAAKNWGVERAIEADLLAGAAFEIVRVRLDNPDTDFVVMFNGEVADVKIGEIEVTIRGQTLDFLNYEIPKREYQVMCNWRLYDQYCGAPISFYAVGLSFPESLPVLDRKTIAGVTWFQHNSAGYWNQGYVRIDTGENADIRRQVSSHPGNTVTVVPPFPFSIGTNDSFTIFPGCKHDVDDCEDKFNNLINYGGFPFIPRQDEAV